VEVILIKNLKRNVSILFRVTASERELIAKKMEAVGINNREAYLRKMVLDGYIVRLDLKEVRNMLRLLSNAANNVNQIAKRANETRSVYSSDIQDLKKEIDNIKDQVSDIIEVLKSLRQ